MWAIPVVMLTVIVFTNALSIKAPSIQVPNNTVIPNSLTGVKSGIMQIIPLSNSRCSACYLEASAKAIITPTLVSITVQEHKVDDNCSIPSRTYAISVTDVIATRFFGKLSMNGEVIGQRCFQLYHNDTYTHLVLNVVSFKCPTEDVQCISDNAGTLLSQQLLFVLEDDHSTAIFLFIGIGVTITVLLLAATVAVFLLCFRRWHRGYQELQDLPVQFKREINFT